ncbi:unnamed protein product [Sympodiomycopsis kandeliae]
MASIARARFPLRYESGARGLSKLVCRTATNVVGSRNQQWRCSSTSSAPASESSSEPGRYQNEALRTLQDRQLFQSVSSSHLDSHLSSGKRSIYLGIDPTASSLHVGNLLPILALLWLVKSGHKGVLLVGGATGSIGDPSGKTSERSDLPEEILEQNISSITQQLQDLVKKIEAYLQDRRELTSSLDIQVLNNAEFYKEVNILSFLKDIGRFVRIGEVLARDSVKTRLPPPHGTSQSPNAGLSFTEFSYQLLQANDFYLLNERQDTQCTIQLGGSDQMGNIMAGVDLIRRKKFGAGSTDLDDQDSSDQQEGMKRQPPAYALTIPLLTTSSGEKIGKSSGNAIFLSSELSSDLEFYQYFLKVSDSDADRLLNSLTFLTAQEIDTRLQSMPSSIRNRKQQLLAKEMTLMLRGQESLDNAESLTQLLYGELFRASSRHDLKQIIKGREETLWQNLYPIGNQQSNSNKYFVKVIKRRYCVDVDLLTLLLKLGFGESASQIRQLLKGNNNSRAGSASPSGFSLNGQNLSPDPRNIRNVKLRQDDIVPLGNEGKGMFLMQKGKADIRVLLVE